jgi:predicted Zn-dependent protease
MSMSLPAREALAVLGFFYLQNCRPDQAMTIFAALDALQPGDRHTVTSLALSQLRAGKTERALQTLEKMALLGFVDGAFHLMRAQALSALSRRGEAAAAMQAYVTQRPSAPSAMRAASTQAH